MKTFKIKSISSGNCECANCGMVQDDRKMHPYTVWWKLDTEKRGHQEPVCSIECAEEYIKMQG